MIFYSLNSRFDSERTFCWHWFPDQFLAQAQRNVSGCLGCDTQSPEWQGKGTQGCEAEDSAVDSQYSPVEKYLTSAILVHKLNTKVTIATNCKTNT